MPMCDKCGCRDFHNKPDDPFDVKDLLHPNETSEEFWDHEDEDGPFDN